MLNLSAYDKLVYEGHMNFFGKSIASGMSVLDLSSNGGIFAYGIAERGAQITVCDISRKKLDIAEERLYQEGYGGQFIQASVTDLSFIDNCSFDTVICCGNLFNALGDKTERAINELKRVTKIGGSVIISVLGLGSVMRSVALNEKGSDGAEVKRTLSYLAQSGRMGDTEESLYYYTSEDLERLFTDCHFMKIKTAGIPSLFAGRREEINRIDPFSDDFENISHAEREASALKYASDCSDFIIARGIRV